MDAREKKNLKTLGGVVAVIMVMIGLTAASVPLYELFCKVTGYGGTTQVAEALPAEQANRTMTVRFDSNVAEGMPWKFKPETKPMTLHLGENGLAFYRATNTSDKPIVGTATYSVTPHKAGQYFAKIQCFCFTEQVLMPGESVDMPVSFFVDPDLVHDKNMEDVSVITLSYTFFRAPEEDAKEALKNRVSDAASHVPADGQVVN